MRIIPRKTWFYPLVLFLLVPAAGSAADFQAVLAGIDRYYETVSSLQASFTQLVEVPVLEKSETFSGTLFFLKPNLIRLEYSKPEGQLLVADGTDWWFYMPQQEVPQVLRAPMKQEPGEAPVYILGGRMAERFSGRLTGTERRGGTECYVLELQPRSRTAYYRSLRAWVGTRTFATRAVRYVDESGNFNTFDLAGHRAGIELPPAMFSFEPPAEAQVLEAESPGGERAP
ncbi:MAG: outer membrane lipoprotein carrier protein LolA [Candidatus Glassbacteria bacterium]|nr:outer membrane lipoprotein carrier protein LolA [Candidatus Glassbacteria bacterium]